jgi:hypothetical protein
MRVSHSTSSTRGQVAVPTRAVSFALKFEDSEQEAYSIAIVRH